MAAKNLCCKKYHYLFNNNGVQRYWLLLKSLLGDSHFLPFVPTWTHSMVGKCIHLPKASILISRFNLREVFPSSHSSIGTPTCPAVVGHCLWELTRQDEETREIGLCAHWAALCLVITMETARGDLPVLTLFSRLGHVPSKDPPSPQPGQALNLNHLCPQLCLGHHHDKT